MLTQSILTSWLIILILLIWAWLSGRKLKERPSSYQVVTEGIYLAMYDAVNEVLPEHVELIFPFVATLWLFIVLSNLIGVIPGLSSPTADLSVTSSLAIVTFFPFIGLVYVQKELKIICDTIFHRVLCYCLFI